MRGNIRKAALSLLALAALNLASAGADELPDVPYHDLRFVHVVSFSMLHTSLEGAPDVPAGGVQVSLTCVIRAGKLTDCVPDAQSNASQRNFVSVALKRAKVMEVQPTTMYSEPTDGRRTVVKLAIKPTDRMAGTSVDFINGDLVTYTSKPTPQDLSRFYPIRALDREVEAVMDMACIVTASYSLACDDVRVTLLPEPPADPNRGDTLRHEFANAARKIMALYVVSPKLSNGQAAVGTGVRHRMRFMVAGLDR